MNVTICAGCSGTGQIQLEGEWGWCRRCGGTGSAVDLRIRTDVELLNEFMDYHWPEERDNPHARMEMSRTLHFQCVVLGERVRDLGRVIVSVVRDYLNRLRGRIHPKEGADRGTSDHFKP